ncbi:hypothetical protein BX666DRAFT_290791 [Dichotomocladium elegans]|nr:hypothetical protein BX666DRAFT_290791 [Dichotomocladium elegans]
MISTRYATLIGLLILSTWVPNIACQSLGNPIIWKSARTYCNSTGSASYNDHIAQISTTEDFQTIYAGGDPPISPRQHYS